MKPHSWAALAASLMTLPALATVSNGEFTDKFAAIPGYRESTGTLIVGPMDGRDAALGGLEVVSRLCGGTFAVVRVPSGHEIASYANRLRASGDFAIVEPNWRVFASRIPNDPRFRDQWHHTRIRSAFAWNFLTGARAGNPDVVIAILDSGVYKSHEDLSMRLVPGYDAVTGLAEPSGVVEDSSFIGHGTRVAGVAAAGGDNGTGVCGVGWNFKIMPVRITADPADTPPFLPSAEIAKILDGMSWAAAHGAKIINVSYSGGTSAAVDSLAGQLRTQYGSLTVFSAGNQGQDLGADQSPNVIIVGGTETTDVRWPSSNYGNAVDCMAPCTSILTTSKSGDYVAGTGTSFAAPLVSGVLGMIFSYKPNLTAVQAENVLFRSCTDLGAYGRDPIFGHGRINVEQALKVQFLYHITELGPGGGYPQSRTVSIDDSSEAVGYSGSLLDLPGEERHATAWSGGSVSIAGTVFGNPVSDYYDVNRYGFAVGSVLDATGTLRQPLFWDRSQHTLLACQPYGATGWANGINDAGRMCGIILFDPQGGSPYGHAATWANAGASPTLLSLGSFGLTKSSASKVFNDGSIIGYLANEDFTVFRGALWSDPGAAPTLLAPIGPYVHGIANGGVDRDLLVGGLGIHNVDPGGAVVWKQGVPSFLPEPPGTTASSAGAATSNSLIGGFYQLPGDPYWKTRACIWQNNFVFDLGDFRDDTSLDWDLATIDKITEYGQIVGYGYRSGVKRAYIGTPVFGAGGQAGLTVNCSVILGDYLADAGAVPVSFEVIREGNNETVGTYTATRDPDTGFYSLPTGSLRGLVRIRAKGPHWLTREVHGISVNDMGTAGADFILINGDLDDNNSIDSDDFDALVAGFGIGADGDLNGDESTDSDDFDILVKNFGQFGD